jgi:hypothetical protein
VQASPAQVRPQHSILFPQERDYAVLLAHDPTAQSRDEQLERRHGGILRHPTFDPVLGQYDVEYYMNTRTHLSLGKDAPASRPATPLSAGRIVEIPQVNGLHHRYDRAAA